MRISPRRSPSATPGPASRRISSRGFLSRSSRRKRRAWGSGCPSSDLWSKHTADESGRRTNQKGGRRSGSRCPRAANKPTPSPRHPASTLRDLYMSAQTPIIHVVDDDDSLRTSLTRLLRAAGYEVRSYSSAGEFLLARPANTPGCVILDVRMPGPSGLDLQDAFRHHNDSLPIIFLTGHGDIPMSVRAIKSGAVDFLTKPVPRQVLLNAVETALRRDGESRIARDQDGCLRACFETLTPRERAVFTLVAAGKANKQIATELGTSERTVKAHRARVMEKMQVTSLAELVRVADRLQPPGPIR